MPTPGPADAERAGFPRGLRLRKPAEFRVVRLRGRTLADGALRIGWLDTGVDRPARVGLAVSRRQGGAVVRNRVRRVIREAFRRERGLLPRGVDLVVVPRGPAAGEFASVRRSLQRLFARIAAEQAAGSDP